MKSAVREKPAPPPAAVIPTWPAAPLLFLVLAAALYFPALKAPFIFDDDAAVVSNPNVRQLWPLSQSLWAPPNAPVAGRPLVSFTLAVNHALGGFDVFGYHLFNLLVHVACAALLFNVVRRGLEKSLAYNPEPTNGAALALLQLYAANRNGAKHWDVHDRVFGKGTPPKEIRELDKTVAR